MNSNIWHVICVLSAHYVNSWTFCSHIIRNSDLELFVLVLHQTAVVLLNSSDFIITIMPAITVPNNDIRLPPEMKYERNQMHRDRATVSLFFFFFSFHFSFPCTFSDSVYCSATDRYYQLCGLCISTDLWRYCSVFSFFQFVRIFLAWWNSKPALAHATHFRFRSKFKFSTDVGWLGTNTMDTTLGCDKQQLIANWTCSLLISFVVVYFA